MKVIVLFCRLRALWSALRVAVGSRTVFAVWRFTLFEAWTRAFAPIFNVPAGGNEGGLSRVAR